jgi:hypothetical protein
MSLVHHYDLRKSPNIYNRFCGYKKARTVEENQLKNY